MYLVSIAFGCKMYVCMRRFLLYRDDNNDDTGQRGSPLFLLIYRQTEI